MKLTRAQIVGLYGLAMNMPTDTEIDVLTFDDCGNATIEAKSNSTGQQQHFRLLAAGGTESVSGS